ncbi:aminopeptidase N [Nocardioides sp.]|uniref:aminopeptidase N n=1 Tax=Nocardioides sp. TaxID=35761 RepID=UPI0026296AFF|nr:aminopeptidase N [Nocardioides sp.]
MSTTSTGQSQSLQRSEAEARRALLSLTEYDVTLDLSADEATYNSLTRLTFESQAGETFLDLKPVAVASIHLDGEPLDVHLLAQGRFPLSLSAGTHELVVDATMRFRNDGEGLHRSVDPADGRHYVYGMSFMDAAPSIFACFDQPDLKAPYVVHVRAPQDWVVRANGAGTQVEPGVWEFERTPPLSTYFVTLVAGPYHVLADEHDGIALGLLSRASLAADLEEQATDILTVTKQSFDEFHRLFGVRYAFGKYDQCFVPEFNAGAMENPGCVTFRDPLIFTSRATRGALIQRATTIAHEMAHQWFGNLVTPVWWDDLWLNESFAEYLGNRVTADVTEYDDTWTATTYARRQWGLIADQAPSTHPVAGNGAVDAVAALQDFDGISYTKGSAILKQLAATHGDGVFFGGVRDHFDRHRFGNATLADLLGSWSRAGAGDLTDFSAQWLRTAGADLLSFERGSGDVLRSAPAEHPADRSHTFQIAASDDGAHWYLHDVAVSGERTESSVGDGKLVILDPYDDTWAVTVPDATTAEALVTALPRTRDAGLRAGIWNTLRNGFHNALVDPATVIDIAVTSLPLEDAEDGPRRVRAWLLGKVVPLAPAGSMERLAHAASAALAAQESGSELQLSAFRMLLSTTDSPDLLRRFLEAAPGGIDLDRSLRWRILGRLAELGAASREELQQAFGDDPSGDAKVSLTAALCSLPDEAAKAWAWSVFTGETDVPNYEIEAAGQGLWRGDVPEITGPYVARYFDELPATASVRSGWVLADAAGAFFPAGSLEQSTLERAEAVLADDSLAAPLRRRLSDSTDGLRRQLAVRRAFPRG